MPEQPGEPSGPAGVDPHSLRTRQELARAIDRILTASGKPVGRIAEETGVLAEQPGTGGRVLEGCSRQSLNNWRTGRNLPRIAALHAVLLVCGVPEDRLDAWTDVVEVIGPRRARPAPADVEPDPPEPELSAPQPAAPQPAAPQPAEPQPPATGEQDAARRRRTGTTARVAALLAIATVAAAVLAVVVPRGVEPDSAGAGSVALLLVAGPLLVVSAIVLAYVVAGEVRRSRERPTVDVEAELDRWALALADRWAADLRSQRRIGPALRVRWRIDRPTVPLWRAVTDSGRERPGYTRAAQRGWPTGPTALADVDDRLAGALLDRIPNRRLVLWGGSGSGKSVLLLQLALGLHERAAAGRRLPRPVLFSLAGWEPGEQDLDGWLADQMVRDEARLGLTATGRLGRAAEMLLADGRILPLLDGLDEIGDPARRAAALQAIDRWLTAQHRPGLVVASQPFPGAVPPGATVTAHVEDLTKDQIVEFLDGHTGLRWRPLLTGHVERAVDRPLTVGLAAEVHPRGRPDEAAALHDLENPEQVRDRLLAQLLPVVYRQPPRWRWTPRRAARWLRTVAELTSRTRRPMLWWELREEVPRGLVPAVLGLPGGIAVGLVGGLDPTLGWGVGLGILVGIAAAWAAARSLPAPADTDRAGDVGPGIAAGFVGGAVGALLGGLVGVGLGVTDTVVRGVMGGLGAGIAAGASTGARAGLIGGLAGGITVAFTATGTALSVTGPVAGIVDWLATWLAGALVIGRHGVRLPARRLQRPNPTVAVVTMVICGGGIAVLAGLRHGPVWGVLAGLVSGGLGGIAAGLSAVPVEATGLSADPVRVLRTDRIRFLAMLGLGGISFGIGAAATVGLHVGVAGMVAVGLGAAATRTTWAAFAVSRVWLGRPLRGTLPLRLMTFLADAHGQRRVLRRNGAGYEIRHRELREYLLRNDGAADQPLVTVNQESPAGPPTAADRVR